MSSKSLPLVSLMAATLLNLTSCGQAGKDKKPNEPPLGEVAGAFASTSKQHGIPASILMALVYKESGLHRQPSSGSYSGGSLKLGPERAESLVGLPLATLGLNAAGSPSWQEQLEAYGAWLQGRLAAEHLPLPASLSKNDEVYDWVWQLARLHNSEESSSKNLQIIFAMELIDVLNKGFIWQDPVSQERIELGAAQPPFEVKSFSPPIQANLQLDTRTSELFFVDYLQLSVAGGMAQENRPKKILVTHCPFSLSTCLSSGSGDADPISMQAHYVVPADESVLKNPVKILQHRSPVSLNRDDGTRQLVDDAVVVMLVGDSGRYVEGQRLVSNPSWFSKEQLKNLGKIVAGACQLMVKDDPSLDLARCQTPGEGVVFQSTRPGDTYRFGDIPDFDPTIFNSFIRNPEELSGKVTLDFGGPQKIFAAGSAIPLQLGFIRGTAKIELQFLQRCPSGNTVWSPLQTQFIRNSDRQTLSLTLYDQGPNQNGQHFIRVLTFDAKGKLTGWATQDLFLNSFDAEGVPGPSESLCT